MYIKPFRNGREFETDLLIGTDRSRAQNSPEELGIKERICKPRYLSFSKSILLVKQNQQRGHRSHCPRTPFLKAMYNCIAPALRNGRQELRVFVALWSPLDFFHGVDFFFDYEGKIVTIDVTTKLWKLDYTADVLITAEEIRHNEHYNRARFIAHLLQIKERKFYYP